MRFNLNAKIVIDGMSIPLIDGDFNKASSTKNNLSKSTESKPGLAQEEVINIINKILSNIEDRLEGSLFCNNKQRKKCHGIFHNKSETETDSSSSDSESMDSDWYDLDSINI